MLRAMAGALVVASIACTVGCGDDAGADDGVTSAPATSTTTGGSDRGESGTAAQGPYPRCVAATDCFFAMYEDCISPADGKADGFCSKGCSTPADCPTPDEGDAAPACEDLSGNGPACYLDCSADRACPQGMVCKLVLTTAGERTLCFWSP